MIRRMVVAGLIIFALGAVIWSKPSPPVTRPVVDGTVWQAAGIVPVPRPELAPPLRLSDMSGQTVDLRTLRGRLVMLYFWATW